MSDDQPLTITAWCVQMPNGMVTTSLVGLNAAKVKRALVKALEFQSWEAAQQAGWSVVPVTMRENAA